MTVDCESEASSPTQNHGRLSRSRKELRKAGSSQSDPGSQSDKHTQKFIDKTVSGSLGAGSSSSGKLNPVDVKSRT